MQDVNPLLTGAVESGVYGILLLLSLCLAVSLAFLFLLYGNVRERAMKEAALDALGFGVFALVGLAGMGVTFEWMNRSWDTAVRASVEYCPYLRNDIERGQAPLEAAGEAVATMKDVERSIDMLDTEQTARMVLDRCYEESGWAGFLPRDTVERTEEDGAPSDTADGPTIPALPTPGGGSP